MNEDFLHHIKVKTYSNLLLYIYEGKHKK